MINIKKFKFTSVLIYNRKFLIMNYNLVITIFGTQQTQINQTRHTPFKTQLLNNNKSYISNSLLFITLFINGGFKASAF